MKTDKSKSDYRNTIYDLVKEFRIQQKDFIVELESDNDFGKSFESFCAHEIYGPYLNFEGEIEDSYDLNSQGERNVDIIFNKDHECHVFECKWRNNERGQFDKNWINLIEETSSWISDRTKIQSFPDYAKNKLIDFLDSRSNQKQLHVYLLTNTNVNDELREDFKKRTDKLSQEFTKFNIIFHLKNAAEIYHDWASCNKNELRSIKVLLKDRESKSVDRIFKLKNETRMIFVGMYTKYIKFTAELIPSNFPAFSPYIHPTRAPFF